jgi:hypothetical protein
MSTYHIVNVERGTFLQADERTWGPYHGAAEFTDGSLAESIRVREEKNDRLGDTTIVMSPIFFSARALTQGRPRHHRQGEGRKSDVKRVPIKSDVEEMLDFLAALEFEANDRFRGTEAFKRMIEAGREAMANLELERTGNTPKDATCEQFCCWALQEVARMLREARENGRNPKSAGELK